MANNRNVLNQDVLMALLAMSQDPTASMPGSGMAKDVMADPVGYMPRNMRGRANRPIPQAPDNMNPESWRDRNILAERGRHMRSNPRAGQRDRYPGKGTKFRPPTSLMGNLLPKGLGGDAEMPLVTILKALLKEREFMKSPYGRGPSLPFEDKLRVK